MDPCGTSHIIGNISEFASILQTYWDLFQSTTEHSQRFIRTIVQVKIKHSLFQTGLQLTELDLHCASDSASRCNCTCCLLRSIIGRDNNNNNNIIIIIIIINKNNNNNNIREVIMYPIGCNSSCTIMLQFIN